MRSGIGVSRLDQVRHKGIRTEGSSSSKATIAWHICVIATGVHACLYSRMDYTYLDVIQFVEVAQPIFVDRDTPVTQRWHSKA